MRTFFLTAFFVCADALWAQEPVGVERAEADFEPAFEADSAEETLAVRPMRSFYGPYSGIDFWQLHKGLNARFSLSASVAAGKGSPKGVGFGQEAQVAYVWPVNDRLTLAFGADARHLSWGGYRTTSVGLWGMADYRANDWLSLYAYANVNAKPSGERWHPAMWYMMGEVPKTEVGFGALMKFKNDFTVSISASYIRVDDDQMRIGDRPRSSLQPYKSIAE